MTHSLLKLAHLNGDTASFKTAVENQAQEFMGANGLYAAMNFDYATHNRLFSLFGESEHAFYDELLKELK